MTADSSHTILMVFPNSIWPVMGGGAARCWAMVDALRDAGYVVALVAPEPDAGNEAVEARVDRFIPFQPAGRNLGTRIKDKIAGTSLPERLRMPELEQCVADVARQLDPVACITHFVRTASILDNLPDSCLRLMDTHDIQHLRGKDAARHGGTYTGSPWSRDDETHELNRADVLIAIQDMEAATLRELCPKKSVITVGHAVPVEKASEPATPPSLLYVGNNYAPNVEGLILFLSDAWPAIHDAQSDIELHVCGRVCQAIDVIPDGVMMHGVVDDLAQHYRRATAVINPVTYGTGLKIKTVEALGFGKAVVSTPAGVLGVAADGGSPVWVVETPGAMAAPLIELVQLPDLRMEWEGKAHSFARQNLTSERIIGPLVALLKNREAI